ncbi:hypothetical protein MASR1M101_10470 [Gemmatimonas sp.]
MRLPLQVITKEPRTINARMRPKVTERGQPLELVGMEEAAAVTLLGQTPPHQPYGRPNREPEPHQPGHLPTIWSL